MSESKPEVEPVNNVNMERREWPIVGYSGPTRTPIRVILVDEAGNPMTPPPALAPETPRKRKPRTPPRWYQPST